MAVTYAAHHWQQFIYTQLSACQWTSYSGAEDASISNSRGFPKPYQVTARSGPASQGPLPVSDKISIERKDQDRGPAQHCTWERPREVRIYYHAMKADRKRAVRLCCVFSEYAAGEGRQAIAIIDNRDIHIRSAAETLSGRIRARTRAHRTHRQWVYVLTRPAGNSARTRASRASLNAYLNARPKCSRPDARRARTIQAQATAVYPRLIMPCMRVE